MYKLAILTSLYDDYAPQLLKTIDENIDSGIIVAEPFLICNQLLNVKKEDFERRLETVRQLKHLGKYIMIFPSKDFKSEDPKWRDYHDSVLKEKLPEANSYLNVGYMQFMTSILYDSFDIVNLHPAIPEVGPIGIWTKVMKEQAERPLIEIIERGIEEIDNVLKGRKNKAGGMLHLVTTEPDRGPVISYYDFTLTSPTMCSLFQKLAIELEDKSFKDVEKGEYWQALAGQTGEIRKEQFKGEEPLIIFTYNKLTRDNWKIENRMLYVKENDSWTPYPNGYCLNQEIGQWLKERRIEGLIK